MKKEYAATPKQVNYALHLLAEAGYDTKWMGAEYKKLGAKMRERSGSVLGWLEGHSRKDISDLIDRLKQ